MKKTINQEDEAITRKVLKEELRLVRIGFKRDLTKLRNEVHSTEYRLDTKIDFRFNELNTKMDQGFNTIIHEMKKHTDTFQKLADKVIGMHNNFEVESVSIRQNYIQLETRVKKVEIVVFPNQAG